MTISNVPPESVNTLMLAINGPLLCEKAPEWRPRAPRSRLSPAQAAKRPMVQQ